MYVDVRRRLVNFLFLINIRSKQGGGVYNAPLGKVPPVQYHCYIVIIKLKSKGSIQFRVDPVIPDCLLTGQPS